MRGREVYSLGELKPGDFVVFNPLCETLALVSRIESGCLFVVTAGHEVQYDDPREFIFKLRPRIVDPRDVVSEFNRFSWEAKSAEQKLTAIAKTINL